MTPYDHPKGLIRLGICYTFFMAGFTSMLASLVFYQRTVLGLSPEVSYGIYGAASTFDLPEGGGMGTAPVPGNTFCAPSLSKFLTFPRGRSDGLVINLDTTKTNAADCF